MNMNNITDGDSSDNNDNIRPDPQTIAIAFALVFGAGMATAIGASVVIFLPKLLVNNSSSGNYNLHNTVLNRYVLASSLGISAGVMIYVSFIEIFQKSRIAFIDAGYAENIAYIYATLCFFGGVTIMMILNTLVTQFLHSHHHHHQSPELQRNVQQTHQQHRHHNNATTTTTTTSDSQHQQHQQPHILQLPEPQQQQPTGICCSSEDPIRDLEILHQMAEILVAEQEQERENNNHNRKVVGILKPTTTTTTETITTTPSSPTTTMKVEEISSTNQHRLPEEGVVVIDDGPSTINDDDDTNNQRNNEVVAGVEDGVESNASGSSHHSDPHNNNDNNNNDHDRKLLLRMSMNTAIAIGLHNFPEGLATFVATLHDPHVGVVLAIAIAIHNIPEGLCVALPIYYATGSRKKAFSWAILSGLSEPLAAILGYVILANAVTGTIYGILFGIVAGMMVMICIRELLPTAHRYDPSDRVVTYSFIFGMGILALSLVLFAL